MISRPLTFISKKPSSIRLSGGISDLGLTLASGLLCINAAVSGFRMPRPFSRCAIMNLAMSTPEDASEPAGPTWTHSKPRAGLDACW